MFQQQMHGPSHDHNWKKKKLKKMVRNLLDGAAIATCLSSLVPQRWQFKMWVVFLLQPIYIWCSDLMI